MGVTKAANKITILMGLIIMQASKNFKSNRLLRVFERSKGILETCVKYMNQLGMNRYSISARNYPYGVFMWQELQGSRHKRILGTTECITKHLVITRATGI